MIGCYQQTPFIRSIVADPFQRLSGQPSIHCEAGDHFFLYGFLRIDRISGQDHIFPAAANFCTEQSVAVSRCVDKDNTSITKYIVGSSHRPNPCLLISKRFYIGKVPSAFHIAEKVFLLSAISSFAAIICFASFTSRNPLVWSKSIWLKKR